MKWLRSSMTWICYITCAKLLTIPSSLSLPMKHLLAYCVSTHIPSTCTCDSDKSKQSFHWKKRVMVQKKMDAKKKTTTTKQEKANIDSLSEIKPTTPENQLDSKLGSLTLKKSACSKIHFLKIINQPCTGNLLPFFSFLFIFHHANPFLALSSSSISLSLCFFFVVVLALFGQRPGNFAQKNSVREILCSVRKKKASFAWNSLMEVTHHIYTGQLANQAAALSHMVETYGRWVVCTYECIRAWEQWTHSTVWDMYAAIEATGTIHWICPM